MREYLYRAHLSGRLGERSADSYVSNCRRVERTLGTALDTADLSEPAIEAIGAALARVGLPRTSIADCLSAVRSYAGFRRVPEPPPTDVPARTELVGSVDRFGGMTGLDLLGLHGRIIDELRPRGVLRTGNGPIGDYAELLFARAFGWHLQANSAAGHDAVDAPGTRYQTKARRLATPAASRQLGAIRRLPDHTFDVLAAVLFDAECRVARAILLPHALVSSLAKRSDHTNSWRLMLSDKLWALPGVRDVTRPLLLAQRDA